MSARRLAPVSGTELAICAVTEIAPPSWEEVARIHGRKIYNFAYRLCGNPNDAADLAQEVLLRVGRGLASCRPGSFDGWLWRVTRNAFIDEVRRRNRRPTSPLPEALDCWDVQAAPAADEQLAARRLGEDVQEALLALSLEFREAVVMCDVVGLSYQEIAQALGVPVGTVRSRIHRGRKLLRSALVDEAATRGMGDGGRVWNGSAAHSRPDEAAPGLANHGPVSIASRTTDTIP